MSEITEMIREFHGNAVMKGFYEQPTRILNFYESLDTADAKAIRNAFIAQRLQLISSEIGEAMEALRKDRYANLQEFEKNFYGQPDDSPKRFKEDFNASVKDSFEDELADAFIRILDLAGWMNIDLEKHVALKHKYNTGRQYLHGKNC